MEILGHIVTGPTVRPLPTTTTEWLIQISADVTACNDKIDRLITGAVTLDGRVDQVEAWRERVELDVAKLPAIVDWQQAMDTRLAGIRFSVAFASGLIGLIGGIIGATVAVVTNLAQALAGRHP